MKRMFHMERNGKALCMTAITKLGFHILSCREAISTSIDRLHITPILSSYSDPDLTKSQHIKELTRMGKNTIKKINVQAITDKCTHLRLCLEQQKMP